METGYEPFDDRIGGGCRVRAAGFRFGCRVQGVGSMA